jgi:hypothetical protein
MNRRPDRTACIVEDLCRHRTDEQASKRTIPMSGHHDQVDVFQTGILHNLRCRVVAFLQDALHPEVAPFIGSEFLHVLFSLFPCEAMQHPQLG